MVPPEVFGMFSEWSRFAGQRLSALRAILFFANAESLLQREHILAVLSTKIKRLSDAGRG